GRDAVEFLQALEHALALGGILFLVAGDEQEEVFPLPAFEAYAIGEAHGHFHGNVRLAPQHQAEKRVRTIAHLARQNPVGETLFAPLARIVPILQVHSVVQVPEYIRHFRPVRIRHGTIMPFSRGFGRTLFKGRGLSTIRGFRFLGRNPDGKHYPFKSPKNSEASPPLLTSSLSL